MSSWRRLGDSGDDVDVGSAAAQVAAHPLAYLGIVELDRLLSDVSADRARPAPLHLVEHGDRRADLSRGAVTALQRVPFHERTLHRMQITAGPQTLNGGDLLPAGR